MDVGIDEVIVLQDYRYFVKYTISEHDDRMKNRQEKIIVWLKIIEFI